MSCEFSIKVENLSKCYQIYDQPHDRLKQFVLPRLNAVTGFGQKKYYREFWSLKDVSLDIKKGETVGIIGRNGSGKSTLLQIICGTLSPTSGNVTSHGRIAALLELGAGFNPEFTGRENIYMNASILGLTKQEIEARFEEFVAFADIGDFIEHHSSLDEDDEEPTKKCARIAEQTHVSNGSTREMSIDVDNQPITIDSDSSDGDNIGYDDIAAHP